MAPEGQPEEADNPLNPRTDWGPLMLTAHGRSDPTGRSREEPTGEAGGGLTSKSVWGGPRALVDHELADGGVFWSMGSAAYDSPGGEARGVGILAEVAPCSYVDQEQGTAGRMRGFDSQAGWVFRLVRYGASSWAVGRCLEQ